MSITVEEFINPKSMITPGAAAAIVATIAGAFFSMFGIVLQVSLITLSFFVGVVVFFSKEFASPNMAKGAKAFYYILNSIIIFAMATGTHAVLDGGASASAELSFVGAVHARGTQQSAPQPRQKRPFFYDWTKRDVVPTVASTENVDALRFSVSEDFGRLKRFLVDTRVATPLYRVTVEIDKSKVPDNVKSVTWELPKAYFADHKVTTTDKAKNFVVNIQAWKPFPIVAEIELDSGEKLRVEDVITLGTPEP